MPLAPFALLTLGPLAAQAAGRSREERDKLAQVAMAQSRALTAARAKAKAEEKKAKALLDGARAYHAETEQKIRRLEQQVTAAQQKVAQCEHALNVAQTPGPDPMGARFGPGEPPPTGVAPRPAAPRSPAPQYPPQAPRLPQIDTRALTEGLMEILPGSPTPTSAPQPQPSAPVPTAPAPGPEEQKRAALKSGLSVPTGAAEGSAAKTAPPPTSVHPQFQSLKPSTTRSPAASAKILLQYATDLVNAGKTRMLGDKSNRNAVVAQAQLDMGGIAVDGIYGPETRARGSKLLMGAKFPTRV